MHNTFLEKNPFYVLEVSPGDKRASIISKAEEKAFFDDSNACEEAQASLINPTKRLSAELEWFFDISEKKQTEIFRSIKNKKEIFTDELSGISRLNALLHNFSVVDFEDFLSIIFVISEIDKLYEKINPSDVCDLINKYRAKSGIAPTAENDVVSAFNKKRVAIRRIISDRLEALDETDYVELVSTIAENFIANSTYDDGVVIDDIINQYEVRMNYVIDKKANAAMSVIEKVDFDTNISEINLTVENLIVILKEFDKYAQPLQIKSMADGLDHEQSLQLAHKCREFAIKLHNEYSNFNASFKLIQTLREIFSELTEFAEIIANDEKQIIKARKEKKLFQKNLEANRQANKRYTVSIRSERFVIPKFCTCCMKPTRETEGLSYTTTYLKGQKQATRSISLDLPLCEECLKHRSKYNSLLALICTFSIIIGFAFSTVFWLAKFSYFLSFLFGACASIVAYFCISAVWKTKPLAHEHARRGNSAEISASFSFYDNGFGGNSPSLSSIEFTFYNYEYACSFRNANKDIASYVVEETEINTARSTSVLQANEHPVLSMFKMLGVFAFFAALIGSVITQLSGLYL